MSGTVTVDQAALVLNSFCALLENTLVSAEIAKWNEHSGELDDTNKLVVHEQFGPRYKITKTTDGVKDLSSGVDGSVFGSEVFKVNTTYNANMGWGDFIKIRDVGQARENEALTGAASSMAHSIDADILSLAALASPDWVGTPANKIATVDDFASGYTRLMENGVDDNNLMGVLAYADQQALAKQLTTSISSGQGETEKAIRQGFSGELIGIPTLFTQQLPTLTTGTATNGAVNGANQNVNYSAVAVSSGPGLRATQTLNVNGLGANATVVAGQVFTLAGVNAYDNRKQAKVAPTRLQQFTVVANATADGTGAAALTIFPAIIVPGSGSGDDVDINTAHATVDAAPINTAVLTWATSASTGYTPRMIIQKGAITVDTIPLIMPATGTAMRRKLDKVPVTVRMWKHSDFNTGNHNVRFDVALTGNIRDRRRICRVNGA
jgi:hypothetical protein